MPAHQSPLPRLRVNRLRVLREQAGVSQEDMARLLVIKRQTLSRLETGKQPIPDYLIARILALYKEQFDTALSFEDLYTL